MFLGCYLYQQDGVQIAADLWTSTKITVARESAKALREDVDLEGIISSKTGSCRDAAN